MNLPRSLIVRAASLVTVAGYFVYTSEAADRVALLIANGRYREPSTRTVDTVYLPQLDSPAADLALMEKTLTAAGFVCTTLGDRATAEMRADVQQFATQNKGAPVVLFYYSGHGLAQEGVNYLAGVDARIDVSEKLGDLERARASGALSPEMLASALADIKRRKAQEQLMPLDEVLTALSGMSGTRGDRKIVLLDACRDPFASSEREHTLLAAKGTGIIGKGGSGLAKPTERPGMFIGFSAAAGQVSIAFPSKFGKAEPSLFTRAFCAEAVKPGVPLRDAFEAAGVVVYDESQKLIDDFRREQRFAGVPAASLTALEAQTPAAYSIVFPPGFSFLPEQKLPPAPGDRAAQMASLTTPGRVADPTSPAATPAFTSLTMGSATKELPFENSLGMQFVPVARTKVLFSVWDTRVQDYEVFIQEMAQQTGREWPKTRFPQGPTHPAVNVNWNDATAFCAWLSKKEGRKYRLPTDAEWSLAAGLGVEQGSTPKDRDGKALGYPWGKERPPPPGAGNYSPDLKVDRFAETAPVGSFAANQFGLFDHGGNVWQWCEDAHSHSDAFRVLRGGSWNDRQETRLRSSYRNSDRPLSFRPDYGFRCVLVVPGG